MTDETDAEILRWKADEPQCGQDFCDECGDCLSCNGGDPCFAGGVNHGPHQWIVYDDRVTPSVAYGKLYGGDPDAR